MISHSNYKDLPKELRHKAAGQMRQRLQTMLANPFLTSEHTGILHTQMQILDKWERGELHGLEPKPVQQLSAPAAIRALPERQPTHHAVGVSDSMHVGEDPIDAEGAAEEK